MDGGRAHLGGRRWNSSGCLGWMVLRKPQPGLPPASPLPRGRAVFPGSLLGRPPADFQTRRALPVSQIVCSRESSCATVTCSFSPTCFCLLCSNRLTPASSRVSERVRSAVRGLGGAGADGTSRRCVCVLAGGAGFHFPSPEPTKTRDGGLDPSPHGLRSTPGPSPLLTGVPGSSTLTGISRDFGSLFSHIFMSLDHGGPWTWLT